MPSNNQGTTRSYNVWTTQECEALKNGVRKHGLGAWEQIRRDPEFVILENRTGVQLKDKFRNLVKFRHISAEESRNLKPKGSGPWSRKHTASSAKSEGGSQLSEEHQHAAALLSLESGIHLPPSGPATTAQPQASGGGPRSGDGGSSEDLDEAAAAAGLMAVAGAPPAPDVLEDPTAQDLLTQDDPMGEDEETAAQRRKRRRTIENRTYGIYDQRRYRTADGRPSLDDDPGSMASEEEPAAYKQASSHGRSSERQHAHRPRRNSGGYHSSGKGGGRYGRSKRGPRSRGRRRDSDSDFTTEEEEEDLELQEDDDMGPEEELYVIDCICGVKHDDGAEMVECEVCKTWCHTHCLQDQSSKSKGAITYDLSHYMCLPCQKRKAALREGRSSKSSRRGGSNAVTAGAATIPLASQGRNNSSNSQSKQHAAQQSQPQHKGPMPPQQPQAPGRDAPAAAGNPPGVPPVPMPAIPAAGIPAHALPIIPGLPMGIGMDMNLMAGVPSLLQSGRFMHDPAGAALFMEAAAGKQEGDAGSRGGSARSASTQLPKGSQAPAGLPPIVAPPFPMGFLPGFPPPFSADHLDSLSVFLAGTRPNSALGNRSAGGGGSNGGAPTPAVSMGPTSPTKLSPGVLPGIPGLIGPSIPGLGLIPGLPPISRHHEPSRLGPHHPTQKQHSSASQDPSAAAAAAATANIKQEPSSSSHHGHQLDGVLGCTSPSKHLSLKDSQNDALGSPTGKSKGGAHQFGSTGRNASGTLSPTNQQRQANGSDGGAATSSQPFGMMRPGSALGDVFSDLDDASLSLLSQPSQAPPSAPPSVGPQDTLLHLTNNRAPTPSAHLLYEQMLRSATPGLDPGLGFGFLHSSLSLNAAAMASASAQLQLLQQQQLAAAAAAAGLPPGAGPNPLEAAAAAHAHAQALHFQALAAHSNLAASALANFNNQHGPAGARPGAAAAYGAGPGAGRTGSSAAEAGPSGDGNANNRSATGSGEKGKSQTAPSDELAHLASSGALTGAATLGLGNPLNHLNPLNPLAGFHALHELRPGTPDALMLLRGSTPTPDALALGLGIPPLAAFPDAHWLLHRGSPALFSNPVSEAAQNLTLQQLNQHQQHVQGHGVQLQHAAPGNVRIKSEPGPDGTGHAHDKEGTGRSDGHGTDQALPGADRARGRDGSMTPPHASDVCADDDPGRHAQQGITNGNASGPAARRVSHQGGRSDVEGSDMTPHAGSERDTPMPRGSSEPALTETAVEALTALQNALPATQSNGHKDNGATSPVSNGKASRHGRSGGAQDVTSSHAHGDPDHAHGGGMRVDANLMDVAVRKSSLSALGAAAELAAAAAAASEDGYFNVEDMLRANTPAPRHMGTQA